MQPRVQPFALADRSRRRPKLTDPYPELEGHPYNPMPAREMPAPEVAALPALQPPIVTKRRERKIDILIRQKIEDTVKEGGVPIITPCYNNLTDPTRPVPEYIKERLEGKSAAQTVEARAKRPAQDAPQTHLLPDIQDMKSMPAAQTSQNDAKPVVNDARKRVRRPIPRPDTSYLTRLAENHTAITAPQHPRSALEAIISDAPNDAIGEETYASLKGMAEDHGEEKEDMIVEDKEHDLTQVEKDHRQEDLALEALNKRLNITQSTVQDANRGLRRLSNKIDDAQAAQMQVEDQDPRTEMRTNVHSETQPGPALSTLPNRGSVPRTNATQPHVCCHCHRHDGSVWGQLWTEFASNFYNYDATRNFYHNITWLGWSTILWIIWLMTEMALYPYYADELFGPLFPFVTMNVCLRPFMPILVPTFRYLSWAIGTLFHFVFGETATSNGRTASGKVTSRVLDTAASIPQTTASITKNIVQSTWQAANELHEHMGMGYDDYL